MEKTKKEVKYGICACMILLLLGLLYYADFSNKSLYVKNDNDNYTYVSKLFDQGVRTVVSTSKVVMRPYNNADVKALKNFYDYKGEESTQENSIINYDTTYIQNNGVIYGGVEEAFEVRAALEGKVISVKDDKLLGKIVTIEHENNIVTTYESLSEVTVKENDEVSQATIIGKAGPSNLEKDAGNILLFEMTIGGKYVNPEDVFDKQVSDLKIN